jgi:enolase-phosphatase E1
MSKHPIRFILTDIEGTTSSVSFVYDVLFPYFREHASELLDLLHVEEVKNAMEAVTQQAYAEEGTPLMNDQEVIHQLIKWSVADKKYTPLKTVQGVLWEKGYQDGSIQGHVYPDVAPMLQKWSSMGIQLGVFSSGSVKAQKLLFGHSVDGNLLSYFSAYFDTTTGMKRETETYQRIANKLDISPDAILFLSDIKEELQAADVAGMQTMQLIRTGNTTSWENIAVDFNEVDKWLSTNSYECI